MLNSFTKIQSHLKSLRERDAKGEEKIMVSLACYSWERREKAIQLPPPASAVSFASDGLRGIARWRGLPGSCWRVR